MGFDGRKLVFDMLVVIGSRLVVRDGRTCCLWCRRRAMHVARCWRCGLPAPVVVAAARHGAHAPGSVMRDKQLEGRRRSVRTRALAQGRPSSY